jgi:hypothetical protein
MDDAQALFSGVSIMANSLRNYLKLLALGGCLFYAGLGNAQFLSAPQGVLDSQYDYRTVAPATSASGFVTDANTQGAARFFYYGDNVFGSVSNPALSIYARALSRAITYTTQTNPAAASQAAFITQLNTNGANGFRFLGNQIFAGQIESVFVKDNSNAVFAYRSRASAANAAAFITALNDEGAAGYQYQGDFTFSEGGSFVNYALFARNTSASNTYTYESLSNSSSATALALQANTQGRRQFRYRGDQSFGTSTFVTVSLYEKNAALNDNFYYQIRSVSDSSASFLSQAGNMGTNRFYFLGTVGFAASPSAELYISVNPSFTNGFE